MTYKVVLAVDGGGIRGLIACRIILRLTDEIRKLSRGSDTHLSDYIDYLAGTSTGSIVVAALAAPSIYNPNSPAFSALDIQSFYLENAKQIFSKSLKHRILSLGGLTNTVYESNGLRDVLYSYFGGLQLSQLLKPCTINSYNLFTHQNLFFRQQDAKQNEEHDFYVRDVCVASSSAPIFYPAARIRNITGDEFLCCDGGTYANNPSLIAYADIRSFDSNAYASNMIFISIGTGWHKTTYDYTSLERAGGAGNWYKAFTDVFIGSVSKSIDYQLRMIYRENPNLYFRWDPQLREGINHAIDTTNNDDLSMFIDCADAFIDTNAGEIKKLAAMLYNNKLPVLKNSEEKDRADAYLSTTDSRPADAVGSNDRSSAGMITPLEPTWSSRYTGMARYPINYETYDNLIDVINHATRINRERTAFESFDQTISYASCASYADQIAGWLQKHAQLEKGDRVGIFLPNLLAFGPIFLGVIKAGMIPVCCNPTYTGHELTHVLKDSSVKLLFAFDRSATVCEKAVADYPVPIITIAITDLFPVFSKALYSFLLNLKLGKPDPWQLSTLRLRDVLKAPGCSVPHAVTVERDDPAVFQYTGGTTGIMKAAVLTHGNLIANILQNISMLPKNYNRPDTQQIIATPLPLYHIFSLTFNLLTCFSMGNHNVLIVNPRNMTLVMKTLSKYRYNLMTTVSPLIARIADHPDVDKIDFSDMQVCIAGAMPVPPSVAEAWYQKTNVRIIQGYGLSEASPVVAVNPYDISSFDGSIGIPLPDTDIALVDENDTSITKTGASGELLVRGPQVMKGYLNQEEETKNVLTEEGWLRTGDVATIDERGFLFIVDRKKNMVNVSGFKVYPTEIEEVIISHQHISDAAVIGVDDPSTGQRVVAYLVPTEAPPSNEDAEQRLCQEVKQWVEERLTGYKHPREYILIDEIPKTVVGKTLHRQLREQYEKKN